MNVENIKTAFNVAKYASIFKTPQIIKKGKAEFLLQAKESILIDTDIDYPPDFDQITSEMFTTPRPVPLFPIEIGPHKAHTAAFPLLNIARKIRELAAPTLKLKGSVLLVAENIDGGQNQAITDSFHAVRPILNKLNTETIGVFRPKDILKMRKNGVTRKEIEKMQEDQKAKIKNSIIEKRTIISLPEGSVKSGRKKEGGKPGEINGMIKLQPNSVKNLAMLIRESGYEPIIFFVGNTGENRIYNPISEKVTKESKIKGAIRALPGGKRLVPSILKSVVDYPTPYEDIERALKENGTLHDGVIEQYCGERLAQLIPYHERGVYKEPTLLNKISGIKTRIKNITVYEKST